MSFNLYYGFMAFRGVSLAVGQLGFPTQPASADSRGGPMRRMAFRRQRLVMQFFNDLFLLEDVATTKEFAINVAGPPETRVPSNRAASTP